MGEKVSDQKEEKVVWKAETVANESEKSPAQREGGEEGTNQMANSIEGKEGTSSDGLHEANSSSSTSTTEVADNTDGEKETSAKIPVATEQAENDVKGTSEKKSDG